MSDTYTRSKIENTFAAYLIKSLELRRKKYLFKKEGLAIREGHLEEMTGMEPSISFEEQMDTHSREKFQQIEKEAGYFFFEELNDDRLIRCLRMLSEEEREIIYQRVFEERPFKEISERTGKPLDRVNGIYYYAVRKIRNWMEGKH